MKKAGDEIENPMGTLRFKHMQKYRVFYEELDLIENACVMLLKTIKNSRRRLSRNPKRVLWGGDGK